MIVSVYTRLTCIAFLIVLSTQITLNAQNFNLLPNGVTVECSAAAVGDTGTVGGVTYTKRTTVQITQANAPTTCTSGITNMSGLFSGLYGYTGIDGDIGSWDVSSVTDMSHMFQGATVFTQNIGSWDVSNVTDMSSMFDGAAFNGNISSWDVRNVTHMDYMFNYAMYFDADLSDWCVTGIADKPYLFDTLTNSAIWGPEKKPVWGTCPIFELLSNDITISCSDVSAGDTGIVGGITYTKRIADDITTANAATSCTSGITNMSNMFQLETTFNANIGSWDVSSVTNMSNMFNDASEFNQDISSWDVSGVTDMSFMFSSFSGSVFNQALGSWDVSSVTSMRGMFSGASAFNADISNWDVSRVTNMSSMFYGASGFYGYGFNTSGAWDVGNVVDMDYMFSEASVFNQDLSSWCVDNITTAPTDFSTSSSLSVGNTPGWGVCPFFLRSNGVTVDCSAASEGDSGTAGGTFYTRRTAAQITEANAAASCTSGIIFMHDLFNGETTFNGDISSWDVSSVLSMSGMFSGASAFNADVSFWDVSRVDIMGSMFSGATAFNQDLTNWCVTNISSEPASFSTSSGLSAVNTPVWGTCPVVTIQTAGYFNLYNNGVVECSGASVGDTGTVGAATYTKRTAAQITTSNAATSCTSGITDMESLFYDASTFNGDISSWDVSGVSNMSRMLSGASVFNRDIGKWDVSGVTDMSFMFSSFSGSVFNQALGSWDVSSVTSMRGMFSGASAFNADISNWDVSRVTNMSSMFYGASGFYGYGFNTSGAWDVGNVVDMDYMFSEASVFNQDLSSWCVDNITTAPTDFSTSSSLSVGNTPGWGMCLGGQSISGDFGWRLLSFPISGGTVNDISNDTPIQGITGGDDETAAANFYLYDDSGVFEKPTNVTTAFGDGKGFAVYFYDNVNEGSSELPITLYAKGDEPSTNVAVSLNPAANGYTLVGNPFSSNFRADASNMEVSGADFIQNNIAFWNDGLGTYSVQDRTTPYIVKPWQGFWVQLGATGGATTLTFNTSGKTTLTATGSFFSKTVASNRGDINFTFSSDSSYDEAIRLSFRGNATTGYDPDDAGKLLPLLSKYAIMGFNSNDLYKSVESIPWDLQEAVTIPMEAQLVGVSGGFTLEWKGFESIPEDWVVTFHDYQTETNVDMRADSLYKFDATAPAAKVNPIEAFANPEAKVQKSKSTVTRFAITISPTSSVSSELDDIAYEFALDQNYPNPFNPSTTINYSVEEAGAVTISVYNLMGQKVATLVNETKSAGHHNVRWNAANNASGMYYYRLEAGGQSITRKMTLIK